MHTFKLKILTPDTKLFSGEVASFTVPTQAGEITVLRNHAPLVTVVSIGEIVVRKENKSEERFLVQGGVIDVKQSSKEEILEVVILADQVLVTENADLKTFEESLERAKLANKENNSEFDLETFESETERGAYFKNLRKK